MRDMPDHKGCCPVEDEAPTLHPFNETVVEIFYQARQSATQVAAEDKTYAYLRPETLVALMGIHGIQQDEWPEITRRVMYLQDLDNQLRRPRPKPKAAPKVHKRF